MLASQRQHEIDKLKEEMALASVKQKKGSVFSKIDQDKEEQLIFGNQLEPVKEEDNDPLDLGNLFALECNQNQKKVFQKLTGAINNKMGAPNV